MEVQNLKALSVATRFLPQGAKIVELTTPAPHPAILLADLDGDQKAEIIVVYQYLGENYVLILKQSGKIWHPLATLKGKGYHLTYLVAAPIMNKQTNTLILAWQVGAIWSTLDMWQWYRGNFQHLTPEDIYFSKIEVEDMPGQNGRDGLAEIALWVHDTGEAYHIDVYRWDHGLVSAKDVYPYYFAKVVPYYQNQLKTMPDARFLWYYLADAQLKAGKPQDTIRSIDHAMQLPYTYPSDETLSALRKQAEEELSSQADR